MTKQPMPEWAVVGTDVLIDPPSGPPSRVKISRVTKSSVFVRGENYSEGYERRFVTLSGYRSVTDRLEEYGSGYSRSYLYPLDSQQARATVARFQQKAVERKARQAAEEFYRARGTQTALNAMNAINEYLESQGVVWSGE